MPLKSFISKSSIYISSYVIVSAISHVFINHTTRSIDPIVTLFYSSVFTIIFFSFLNLKELIKNIKLIKENKNSILWLNLFNAIIWFIAFFSLRVLSPSVFACLFLGAIPINIFILELRNSKVSKKKNLITATLLLVLFMLMLLLVLKDMSETNSSQIVKYGSLVVLVGGIFAALIMKISRKLALKNVSATLVVSLRFYGLLLIALLLLILKPAPILVNFRVLIELFVLALVSMALPLFLLQKSLETISPLYASILITAIPILTYFLQLFTGYYAFSVIKLGITILFSFSLIALAYLKKSE